MADESFKRKLAAVLNADLLGYPQSLMKSSFFYD
jgi:hypothetical protein